MSEGGTRARFVFAAPEGQRVDEPEFRAAIEATLNELRAWPDNVAEVFPDYDGNPLNEEQKAAEVRDPFSNPIDFGERARCDRPDVVSRSIVRSGRGNPRFPGGGRG